MSHFAILQDYPDTTAVPNRFIDEYMASANDAQIKIYLFLLRQLSGRRGASVSEIADTFNYMENDVLRALKYWEQKQLLSLEYNRNSSLCGVRLKSFPAKDSLKTAAAVSSMNETVPPVSVKETNGAEAQVCSMISFMPDDMNDSGKEVQEVKESKKTAPDPYDKPSYTLDQLKHFKESEDSSQLLFIAESYLSKPLSPSDIRTIFFFYDHLKFSVDLIDYLIQYCVDKGKKDFHYMEAVAIGWAKEGIATPKQAMAAVKKYDKTVYAVMKALGKSSSPTAKEVDYIKKWLHTYSFSMNIILEACERTVLATDRNRFQYADSILNSWFKASVHTKNDIAAIDEEHKRTRQLPGKTQADTNKFNQFEQRTYDYEALERELVKG